MFTTVENEYLRGLLNVYYEKGYKNYIAHTVTETDNNYDFYVYLSKDKITANSSHDFVLSDNSIVIYVDSSARSTSGYNPSNSSRDLVSFFSGDLHVHIAEFIYTNANFSYSLINEPINPDILMSGVNSYDNKIFSFGLMFVVVSLFLYMFIKSILRIRR